MLTIWGRKSSSNVKALTWCIGELGLRHERIDAGFTYGVNDTPEFLAMNPNGTVPVLRDGDGEPLWETGAILRYLAEQYADEDFWPREPGRRAQIDKWAEWAKLNVALSFTAPVFWRIVRTARALRDDAAISAALALLGKKFDIAETQLEQHRFLAGEKLTLADIQFGHVLYRYFDIDIPRPPRPRLERYYRNLTERPAFQEHVMVSYEELRVL
ncbi:glutathione S-transferase N-terminal domain-containing protein [Agrobacterium sp. SHOUNA12C]|uniref:glutathione S-transferase family protein n=1 Tax=Rhizobium rhizogenes TaxID=359 RepID=UPI0004D501E7|nr:glutathione S-transferase N-terminal domain-containing protein [Rhizobium rhizogenes]MCJ9724023.1 glutathione S-transferase N-terminal domain-containing protein [Agrobacterium sp. BETTINA12B]MCJ9760883.1 glutathione S-transferase N-terminal domain-containing protein [Agrobacterium sp. SHOUNA12C]KEA07686.1 glutathione S-transferase [Rhizobium rhizogenes]MQB28897.1 glutathione S-transferase [Rhizobium rhizogenes]NTF67233.1 glutathione S-transferase [Rhizobium rhizogenes]